eukprot:scaffold52408_cov78-Attheya_sp.AAC.2
MCYLKRPGAVMYTIIHPICSVTRQPPYVVDHDALLETKLKTWIGKVPALKPFMKEHDTLLHGLLENDIFSNIPVLPTDALIIEDKSNALNGLLGTSGAGKTISLFEYLLHKHGCYFVVDQADNPGSFLGDHLCKPAFVCSPELGS